MGPGSLIVGTFGEVENRCPFARFGFLFLNLDKGLSNMVFVLGNIVITYLGLHSQFTTLQRA